MVNVVLVFELRLGGNLLCLYYSVLRFRTSKFPKIAWGPFGTLVLLVLCQMMWLLYFILFAPDVALAYDFLNAVGSLAGFSVFHQVVCGLYFRLLNFLKLR